MVFNPKAGRLFFTLSTGLLTVVGGVCGLIAAVQGQPVSGLLFGLAWVSFFSLSALVVLLGRSNILVTETLISWQLFGWTWTTLPWSEVRRVVVMVTTSPLNWPSPTEMKIYAFYRGRARLYKPLYFSSNIQDVETLKEFVAAKSLHFGFSIEGPF